MSSHSASTPDLDLDSIITPWKPQPQKRYIFINANVINPVQGTVLENATVHINAGLIVSVNGEEQEWKNDNNVTKIDLKGKYLCPSLIDSHVHIVLPPGEADLAGLKNMTLITSALRSTQVCKAMLERGFTTVRDCGGATASLKQAIAQGVLPGPRLFIAGHALSQTGGHGDMRSPTDEHELCGGAVSGISRIVDGVDACLKYTREELRQGADFIKIMGGGGVASPTDKIEHVQFSDEEIKAIVTVASNAGTYVTSHSYTPRAIQQAIRQGVRGIEHGNLLDVETAKLMAEKGTYLTPTLITHATMALDEFSSFLPASSRPKNKEVLDAGLRALKIASDAGVTICFGSDLMGPLHFAQAREFALRAQVLSSLDVLRSATVNPARMLGMEGFLGQIKQGFAADMLVLEGNPIVDVAVLDAAEGGVLGVVKDGRVVVSRLDGLVVE